MARLNYNTICRLQVLRFTCKTLGCMARATLTLHTSIRMLITMLSSRTSNQTARHIVIAILGSALASHVAAQDAIAEAKLLGSWVVVGSPFQETLTFKGNNELAISTIQTKRDGKPIAPITHTSDAAYKFGSGECKVGQEAGNLFLAKQSDRCCFKIYHIGPTLVFDEVRASSKIPFPHSMCEGKTLRKVPK